MSRHQEQPLKTARDESEGRDKIMKSRHPKRSTETYKGTDWCRDNMSGQFKGCRTRSRCRDMRSMSRHGRGRNKKDEVAT